MRDFLVYLAGPITGQTYDGCTGWRKYVSEQFPEKIVGVSPMRGKDHLSDEEEIKDAYEKHPLSCSKGITRKDRFDVRRCDLLFVNLLDANRVSIGTVMEIAWADAWHKPIVLAMKKDNLHDHAMIRTVVDFRLDDLDSAIKIASIVLLPQL